MVEATRFMTEMKKRYNDAPIIFMGDMNADEKASSQRLLKEGKVRDYNREWVVPITFVDTFREALGDDIWGGTHPGCNCKIDYVYTEKREPGDKSWFRSV